MGYFAYFSPEAYMKDEEDLQIWNAMNDLVKRMCWKIASKRDQICAFEMLARCWCVLLVSISVGEEIKQGRSFTNAQGNFTTNQLVKGCAFTS